MFEIIINIIKNINNVISQIHSNIIPKPNKYVKYYVFLICLTFSSTSYASGFETSNDLLQTSDSIEPKSPDAIFIIIVFSIGIKVHSKAVGSGSSLSKARSTIVSKSEQTITKLSEQAKINPHVDHTLDKFHLKITHAERTRILDFIRGGMGFYY